jgi:hypothetical protein
VQQGAWPWGLQQHAVLFLTWDLKAGHVLLCVSVPAKGAIVQRVMQVS